MRDISQSGYVGEPSGINPKVFAFSYLSYSTPFAICFLLLLFSGVCVCVCVCVCLCAGKTREAVGMGCAAEECKASQEARMSIHIYTHVHVDQACMSIVTRLSQHKHLCVFGGGVCARAHTHVSSRVRTAFTQMCASFSQSGGCLEAVWDLCQNQSTDSEHRRFRFLFPQTPRSKQRPLTQTRGKWKQS